MKEIIHKYLNKTYKLTPVSYKKYTLYDKASDTNVGVQIVLSGIVKVFDIPEDELFDIFDTWFDTQAILLGNVISDFQYKHFQETGMVLDEETALVKLSE